MNFDFSFEGLKQLSDLFLHRVKRFQFGTKNQLAFLEDFYLLVGDGIPANRAIEMMAQAVRTPGACACRLRCARRNIKADGRLAAMCEAIRWANFASQSLDVRRQTERLGPSRFEGSSE